LLFAADDGIVVVERSERSEAVEASYWPRRKKAKKEQKQRKERRSVTTGEYLQTPETVLPCELAYVVMRVAEAPTVKHQRIVGELFLSLTAHVRERQLGEVLLSPIDVILDDDAALVVQPDLIYVSNERSHIVSDRVHGAPDLAVEILSPHTDWSH